MSINNPGATLVENSLNGNNDLGPVVLGEPLMDGYILPPEKWGIFFQGRETSGFLRELIARGPGVEYYLIGGAGRALWGPVNVFGTQGAFQASLFDFDLCADTGGMQALESSVKVTLDGVDLDRQGLKKIREQHKLGITELKNWAQGIDLCSTDDPELQRLRQEINEYQVPSSNDEFVPSMALFQHQTVAMKLQVDGSLRVLDPNGYIERYKDKGYYPLEINPNGLLSLYLRAFQYFDKYPIPSDGFSSYIPVWTIRNIDRMLVDVCERGMTLDTIPNSDNRTYQLVKGLVETLTSNRDLFDRLHALDFVKKEGISLNDSWYREVMWFNAIRAFISDPLELYQLISWDLPLLREILFGDLAKSKLTEDEQFKRFRGAGMYGIFHPGEIKVGVYDSWRDYTSYERATFVTPSVSEIISLFLFAFGVDSEDPRIRQFADNWLLKGKIKANPLISSLPHRMSSKLDYEVIKRTIERLKIVYSLYRNRGRSNLFDQDVQSAKM